MMEAARGSDEDGLELGMEVVAIPPAEAKEPPFLATLNYEREGDISLPMGVEGRKVEDILLPHLTYDDIRTYRAGVRESSVADADIAPPPIYTTLTFPEGINQHNAPYMQFCHPVSKAARRMNRGMGNRGKSKRGKDLVSALARGELEGDQVAHNRTYWDTPDVSALHPLRSLQAISSHRNHSSSHTPTPPLSRPSSRGTELGGEGKVRVDNATTFAPITSSTLPPTLDLSYPDFWGKVAQLPIKTKGEYEKRYEHNMPLPLIQGGADGKDTMVYTLNGAEVYFNILNLILGMEKDIHEDNPLFLRLVFNHIQVIHTYN